MYASLSFGEISIYCITWVSSIFYSIYKLWEATDYMNPNRHKSYEVGWSVSEATDYEWQTWIRFLLFKSPWLISHLVGAELVRRSNIDLVPVWYVLMSVVFLLNFVGASATAAVLLQLLLVYAVAALTRSRLLLWALCALILFYNNSSDLSEVLGLERAEGYLVSICSGWLLLRSLSFCLDGLRRPPTPLRPLAVDATLYLAYALYLPLLVLGPLVLYADFQPALKEAPRPWTLRRVVRGACGILRYVLWGLVMDLTLHYLHFNFLTMIPKKVLTMGNWALYGYGYSLGQFFMLKYVVIYGVGSSIARVEGVDGPPHPKCIARIHLYSDMWRHFDRGLYTFLVKYIYVPWRGGSHNFFRKLFASFMSFVFVYVWHSTYVTILIWSILNFLGVSLEGIGKSIASLPRYRKWEESALSGRGVRRLHALLSTPIFMMSALSNFYFLGSYSIGHIFLTRLLTDSLLHNLCLFAVCYCCCQVSIEASNWELRRRLAVNKKPL